MPLDETFLVRVSPLYVEVMGTENVAPLLYHIARSVRPQVRREVGVGYTTPFLAAALSDSRRDHHLRRPAALARQSHLEDPYAPVLYAFDDLSHGETSAHRVAELLDDPGLREAVRITLADFRGQAATVHPTTCRSTWSTSTRGA